MKDLSCPNCINNNKLDKEEIQNNMDLIFFNCSNCHYKIAISTILNESISKGNKIYKDNLMKLITKNNDKTLFTTNDSFENERKPPYAEWEIIRI